MPAAAGPEGTTMDVRLVPVDEDVLSELLVVAVAEAEPDEVTPPLSAGTEWSEVRRLWFLDYHRSRRAGADGAAAEATWAVTVDGRPVGAVRLKRLPDGSTAETGIWLAKSARGRGVGTSALTATSARARAAGFATVVADTAETNLAAQAAMRRAGFRLARPTTDGRVHGALELHDEALPPLG